LLLSVASAHADETAPLSLEQLIVEAQANNPEIRALTSDIAAAQGEVTTSQTWMNPVLSVSPGLLHQRSPSNTEFHGDFGLEQTFEFPGKRSLRRAVAEKSVELRELALGGFRHQLTIRVRRAYNAMLAAREVQSLKEQRLELTSAFVDAAKKKVEAGFAPDFEAIKAQVEVVVAQKELRDAQADVGAARAQLNTLLGREPSTPLEVAGTLDPSTSFPDRATLLQQALERNPALRIQTAEVERTGLSMQSIRKSRLPDFTVGPNVEYVEDTQIYGLGVSMTLPLWDTKKGEIATATAEQQRAMAELEMVRREILRDVTIAVQNLNSARESLTYYTPSLRASLKEALDGASQSYSEGRTTLLTFLEIRRTYFDSEADYFETLKKLFNAEAELEAAIGMPLAELQEPTDPKEGK
jgi:cobalt-zinc-cadmium efflux system outer membrane protein